MWIRYHASFERGHAAVLAVQNFFLIVLDKGGALIDEFPYAKPQLTPVAAGRTKSIDVLHHFVRHRGLQGYVQAVGVKTEDMKTDMITNTLVTCL